MEFFRKLCRTLFKALEWFAMICMVVLTIIVFLDVIMRYIFKQGFSWSQEVATLMMVWFSLIGMAIGVLEKIHISIEMFTAKLSPRALSVLESIDHLLVAAFGGLMVYFGIQIMVMTKLSTMPATKLPTSVLYVILPLSGILVVLNSILVAAKQDRKIFPQSNSPEKEDTTHA